MPLIFGMLFFEIVKIQHIIPLGPLSKGRRIRIVESGENFSF